jgi:hypothetical protein
MNAPEKLILEDLEDEIQYYEFRILNMYGSVQLLGGKKRIIIKLKLLLS